MWEIQLRWRKGRGRKIWRSDWERTQIYFGVCEKRSTAYSINRKQTSLVFWHIAAHEFMDSRPLHVAAAGICVNRQHLVMFYDSVINILGARQFAKFTIWFDSVEYRVSQTSSVRLSECLLHFQCKCIWFYSASCLRLQNRVGCPK